MYFVWKGNYFGKPSCYKCLKMLLAIDGKEEAHIQKHEIKEDEEHLTLSVLEKIYPYKE